MGERRWSARACNVIYGLLGLKTHAKVLLVVRRERGGLRRYVHLSTGNYNPADRAPLRRTFGLFTANAKIGEDVTSLFNLLTGYSAPPTLEPPPGGAARPARGRAGPDRARGRARARRAPARGIVAQMNALVDVDVIDALYAASQAGVDDQARSCAASAACGRASRASATTSSVRAIIDRFLEHERIFRFDERRQRRGVHAPAPTGCRAITSTAASRSCSRCWTRS